MSLEALAGKALELKLGAIGKLIGALPEGAREKLSAECSRAARTAARVLEDFALESREDGRRDSPPERHGPVKVDIE